MMKRRDYLKVVGAATLASGSAFAKKKAPRNIILVMTDDQGWGQTGYNNHPFLKTPNLDAMAASGLRFDRFYAGGPVCSPTRASVMTGRTHDRTGVLQHGYPLRLQEKTIAQAMKQAGYVTGHFGKWHLNGLRGPGAPVLASDTHNPGVFGFDEWLSVTNFFDMNPLLSRMGKFEDFKGDSSEIVVAEALKFIKRMKAAGKPSFTVIWFGTPHSPWTAYEEDAKVFADLNEKGRQHHGELVAMDRSIGALRGGLKKLGMATDTLVWFNSDNGGLTGVDADTVGGLKGNKGSIWEGGLRVPGIVEWPAGIKPRITGYPAAVVDIFPTIIDLLDLPEESMASLMDGISLVPLFEKELGRRKKPIPFEYNKNTVLIDNDDKIIYNRDKGEYELYNLKDDPTETTNVFDKYPEVADRLKKRVTALAASIEKSQTGADYPEGKITTLEPESMYWAQSPAYKPYLEEFFKRPEYQSQIGKVNKQGTDKKKKKRKKK